ncbi:MAG: hypothetical protein AAB289_09105, partial [Chloroflexota bacterium]
VQQNLGTILARTGLLNPSIPLDKKNLFGVLTELFWPRLGWAWWVCVCGGADRARRRAAVDLR